MHVKPGGRKSAKTMTDEEYNRHRFEEQEMIDQILDKIAKNGYKSLTNKEKEILFRSGNKSN
jgi:hypothetical protein